MDVTTDDIVRWVLMYANDHGKRPKFVVMSPATKATLLHDFATVREVLDGLQVIVDEGCRDDHVALAVHKEVLS